MPSGARAAHAEESAEVEVLLANMDKLKGLTKKIQGSLGRLETSGQNVQDAIRPIRGNTSKLQVLNTNIERINIAIEKIRKPLDQSGAEEHIIRAGLRNIGLQDYLASMDRANRTLIGLRSSNLKTNQRAITQLEQLLQTGRTQLEGNFRDTLMDETVVVEPANYLTKDTPFPSLSEATSSKLRMINAHIASSTSQGNPDSRTSSLWVLVRGPYIATSLHGLAIASLSTARKANAEAIYRQHTCAIGHYSKAIEGLFAAEYKNIYQVFSREQWTRLHTQTCQDAMEELSRTLRELHTHIKSYITTDCFLAYEIIEIISHLAYRLDSTNTDLKQPILDSVRPIRETAKYSLQRLYEETRSQVQAISSLASESAAVPVTFETMTRLQTMTVYLNPLGSILASVGDSGWKSATGPGISSSNSTVRSLDVGSNNGPALFETYVGDTIDVLITGLEGKARTLLKSRSAQGVFIANNVVVVKRLAENSDLKNRVNEGTSLKLDAFLKKGVSMYLEAWKDTPKMLQDVVYTNRGSNPSQRPPSGTHGSQVDSAAFVKGLSNKEKENTKNTFKNFNVAFDDLVAKHKAYKMEREVQAQLAKEVQAMIEPLYTRFWDRYHEIDKGKGKLVKYDKAQLSAILSSMA